MFNSRADIKIINPVFLAILLKYKKLNAFDSERLNAFGITTREARSYAFSGHFDDIELDDDDDTVYVVNLPDFTDEPHFDYGPKKVEDTIDCVLRLIEEECDITNEALFEQFKDEVRANVDQINKNYELIHWDSECEDPFDGWSYFFAYPEDDTAEDNEFDEWIFEEGFGDDDFDENYHSVSSYGTSHMVGADCDINAPIPDVQSAVLKAKEDYDIPTYTRCENLTEVLIEDGVSKIWWQAFAGCKSLKKVRIPGSVKEIGDRAFGPCKAGEAREILEDEYDSKDCKVVWVDNKRTIYKTSITNIFCESLSEVILEEGIEKIGDGAFEGCSALSRIVIPSTVREIESRAFADCTSLSEVVIKGKLTTIEREAFKGIGRDCESVSIVINGDVGTIEREAFAGITNLHRLNINGIIDDTEKSIIEGSGVSEFECKGIRRIGPESFWGSKLKTLPNLSKTKYIGSNAFGECSLLAAAVIPDNVTSIAGAAFAGCDGLLTAVLGNGIKEINDSLFRGCGALEEVFLPEKLKEIGANAFADCVALKEIDLPAGVKLLGERAFENCISLTRFTVNGKVKKIGENIFRGCTGFLDITGESEYVQELDDDLKGIVRPRPLVVPGSRKVVTEEFAKEHEKLDSLVVSKGVQKIEKDAFAGCKYLKSVHIAGSVKTIEECAFEDCKVLSEVVLEEGIEEIEGYAFAGCTSLKDITIPGSVKTIHSRLFEHCELDKVVLCEGVESIEWGALENVERIELPSTIVSIANFSVLGATLVVKEYTEEIRRAARREHAKVMKKAGDRETLIADYSDFDDWYFEDPIRLERAKKLTLKKLDDNRFYITGGRNPHYVTRGTDGHLVCDCPDYADGTKNCKHVIRVRLETEDLEGLTDD